MIFVKTIGDYQFNNKDLIGQGYSSKVYKGQNIKTKQIVAIKVVDHTLLNSHISQTLHKNEIQVLSKIKSPYLLKVYDIELSKHNTYIITEYCEQGDLASLLAQGPLKEETALDILKQILLGLKALNDQGIIHRDIKPPNILIQDDVYKVADFGFSLTLNMFDSTNQNFNVGTPNYMSPETLVYNNYSEKSDIWALGVLFYEMINGELPYKGSNISHLLYLMTTTQIKTQTMLNKMLELDSYKRCGIEELLNMLNNTQRHTLSPMQKQKSQKLILKKVQLSARNNVNPLQMISKNKQEMIKQLGMNEFMELLCKNLEQICDDIVELLVTNKDQQELVNSGKKCIFTCLKCIAIKAQNNYYDRRAIQKFEDYYNKLRNHNFNEKRFQILFDSSIEDDCSGYYGIMLHYINEFKKKIMLTQNQHLVSKLADLSKMIQLHLNNFGEQKYFPSEFIYLLNIV